MDLSRQIPLTPNALLLGLYSRLLVPQDLCSGRTGLDALQPGVEEGEVRLEVEPVSKKEHRNDIPRHERRIGIAELAADEEFLVLEKSVEDAGDAPDLIDVAVDSAGELLGVVDGEPRGLPEVRALAGYLVVQPLLRFEELLRAWGEADVVLLVVGFNQVFDDGARLPQLDARVRVFNCRHTAVGVDRLVRFLLHVRGLNHLVRKRDVELLEDHGHLPGVGAAVVAPESDRLERHVAGLVWAWDWHAGVVRGDGRLNTSAIGSDARDDDGTYLWDRHTVLLSRSNDQRLCLIEPYTSMSFHDQPWSNL